MTGYIIFIGCIVLFAIVYIALRKKINVYNLDCMIFGGGSFGRLSLTCSVFAAWMWTTSVFGSAETYALYGIWGPVSYVAGACIAFAGLIGVLVFFRKRYPRITTWLEFMQIRYGRRTKICFYLFAVIVPAYVLVEQGVGIAYVLETFYGCSFRMISFFSVIVAMGFIFLGGMRLVLTEEKIVTMVIIAGFLAGGIYAVTCGGFAEMTADNDIENSIVLPFSVGLSALQYFVLAIIIAFGQIAFDPAYYFKARLARSTKQLSFSYILGGIVIWGLITLLASLYMGRAAMMSGSEVTDLFHGPAKAVFSFIIIAIGMSTIAHFMIGFLGTFSTDLYDTVVRQEGSDKERIVFGRIMLIAVGISCASITIALENISLLTIDVFCAIFFAAPCVPLIIGCLSQRNFGKLPIVATVLGIVGGLIIWFAVPANAQYSQIFGVAASIAIPLVIMAAGYVKRMPYDG